MSRDCTDIRAGRFCADIRTIPLVCKIINLRSCGPVPTRATLLALSSGVLAANAIPHAYAAAVGGRQLTPLAGRESGPATNAVWSAVNVAAAVAMAKSLDASSADQRRAFKAGAAAFAAWTLISEWATDLNG